MKKLIIGCATLLTVFSATAFAGEKENPALKTFENEFKGATDVRWEQGRDVIKAVFVLNDFRVEAYFGYSGELVGTARNVLFGSLPLAVIKGINNRFGSSPVYEIVEYNLGSETFYQMYVNDSDKRLLVKASASGDISVIKKVKK